ncbi:hypothetical protein M514_02554 [Trichuris suis]|uniref:Uncharacterized protein n=1 Tax=Trichuris suis TaxID=68888 RepID=A0A085MGV4_9BILA|nr:hypothetical protein M513_02554 [Trichuris suis]KFD70978.1 hypothetical protein M514_02554 [Trichuris suis]
MSPKIQELILIKRKPELILRFLALYGDSSLPSSLFSIYAEGVHELWAQLGCGIVDGRYNWLGRKGDADQFRQAILGALQPDLSQLDFKSTWSRNNWCCHASTHSRLQNESNSFLLRFAEDESEHEALYHLIHFGCGALFSYSLRLTVSEHRITLTYCIDHEHFASAAWFLALVRMEFRQRTSTLLLNLIQFGNLFYVVSLKYFAYSWILAAQLSDSDCVISLSVWVHTLGVSRTDII